MSIQDVPRAICIVGDSRSGSTIFQALLELHRDVTAVGELRRLERFIAEGRPCGCGQPVTACEHWRAVMQRAGLWPEEIRTMPPAPKVLRRFEEAAGFAAVALHATALTRPLLARGRVVGDHCTRVLTAAANVTGTRAVVDSSKDPGHAVYLLHQHRMPVHLVFTVRDGRGNVWSKIRRTGMSVDVATRHWARTLHAMIAMRRVLRASQYTWLRYETLCADPRGLMEDLVRRLGLDPAGFAAEIGKTHTIGGTPDFTGISFEAIREDTRWRGEMPAAALERFESIAGKLNRRLGYA